MPLETPQSGAPRGDDARLRAITDALPVGVAYVDQDKIYRFANQRFAAAYGLAPEAILGKHTDEFIWRDPMVLGDPFFEAAHSGQPVDFIHPARHADGRLLTVRTFLRPDLAPEGAVSGFYVSSSSSTTTTSSAARSAASSPASATACWKRREARRRWRSSPASRSCAPW